MADKKYNWKVSYTTNSEDYGGTKRTSKQRHKWTVVRASTASAAKQRVENKTRKVTNVTKIP